MQFAGKPASDLCLRCPLTESMDIVVYVDEQRMSRPDCTDAHTHLDLRWSHMAYRASYSTLHIKLCEQICLRGIRTVKIQISQEALKS